MKESINLQLYQDLLLHIRRMHNDVDYRRSINAYKGNVPGRVRKQYPAVCVGAECNGSTALGNQHSSTNRNDLHIMVEQSLIKKYGGLNIFDGESGNHVGHCAENYAATGVLSDLDTNNNTPKELSEIAFTDALNPRTGKMIDWCTICHNIYD